MPGPGGQGINSLIDLMQPQPGVNPIAGGGNYGTFGLNQWSAGASAPNYFGGGLGAPPGIGQQQGRTIPADLAQYFGAFGQPVIDDPRKVAAESGVTMQDLAGGLLPRYVPGTASQGYAYPSDKGGFFTAEQLYGQPQAPVQPPGMVGAGGERASYSPRGTPPPIATFNQQMPSTNNWRLLGMGPGWIMRNGFLINTLDPAVRSGLPAGASNANPAAAEHGSQPISVGLGTGAPGFPSLWTPAGMSGSYYWPGASTTVPRWGGQTT